jgi:hypothetical protein
VIGLVGLVLLIAGGAAGAWWWKKQHTAPPPPVVVDVPVPVPVPATPPPAEPAATAPETPPAEATLTNDSIIEMVTSKVPTGVILSQMRASKTNFVLTSAEVIRLSKAGVPGPVIEAMRDPKHIPAAPADTKKVTTATTKATVAPPPAAPPVSPQPQNAANKTTAPPPAPPPAPVKPVTVSVPVSVADAMPFSIKLAEDVPADAEEGRALRFTVVDGLKVGENVVIAKGATVTGSVVEAAGKKKIFGMGGKMTFRLLQADAVDGKKLNVRAEPSRGKEGPAKRPIDAGAKGKSKEIAAAAGSEYVAYVEGEQSVTVHK